MTDKVKFEGWSILELMGHRRLAGYVTETEIAGAGMLRLDVPGENGHGPRGTVATQFYSPASIYCLTPTTEEVARALAQRNQPQPVQRWELPPAPAPLDVEFTDGLADPDEEDDLP
jgi:hypothetical protein